MVRTVFFSGNEIRDNELDLGNKKSKPRISSQMKFKIATIIILLVSLNWIILYHFSSCDLQGIKHSIVFLLAYLYTLMDLIIP